MLPTLTLYSSACQVTQWLTNQRFHNYIEIFQNFSGRRNEVYIFIVLCQASKLVYAVSAEKSPRLKRFRTRTHINVTPHACGWYWCVVVLHPYTMCVVCTVFVCVTGADLLRLSRSDLIQLCGLADGIRLNNILHSRYSIVHRRTAVIQLWARRARLFQGCNEIFSNLWGEISGRFFRLLWIQFPVMEIGYTCHSS